MGDNIWKSANSMQEFDRTKVKYYLGEGLKLGENKSGKLAFTTLSVNFKDRSDVDKFVLTDNPELVNESIQEKDNSLLFTTDTFEQDAELTGSFSASLNFSVNKKIVILLQSYTSCFLTENIFFFPAILTEPVTLKTEARDNS